MDVDRTHSLSVVVAAWSGPEALGRCLLALAHQLHPSDQLVVARNFDGAVPLPPLVGSAAQVVPHVVQCDASTNVPRLRAAGLVAAGGDIVAFLEDHAEPLAGWRDAIMAAFRRGDAVDGTAPRAGRAVHAVGGPVAIGAPGRAIDDAVWFYDYARFGPPLPSGVVHSLSGANVAYDREALLEALGDDPGSDRDGLHEASLERALHARGRTLWLAGDAPVRVQRHESASRAIRLAHALARGFGARRAAVARPVARVIQAVSWPLVPPLLFLRTARAAWRMPGLRGRFLRASGWLLLLQLAWGVGEGLGSVFGVGDSDSRWR